MTGLLMLCIPATIQAQHILQSGLNMFRANDVLIKQQVSYKDPGRTGANVLWDFSQLDVVNDEYELFYSTENDTIITGMEHLTLYHYSLQNDSLLLWGFENQTTKLKNKQPELLLHFPVAYGDTVGSYFYGHGKYGNRLELEAMGSIETATDAYGMMILPDKDTLKQVLRTRTLKVIAKESKPISETYYVKDTAQIVFPLDSIQYHLTNDSVLFMVETFRWYEKGYRYPVFETVRSWEQYPAGDASEFLATAFFYPPQEHYYLDDDEENLAVLDSLENESNASNTVIDPWQGLSYNIYPNPVKSAPLEVELYLPQPATIHVQLRSTMGMIALDSNKGYHSEGTCSFQLDTYTLPVGNYILDIRLNEKLISEVIMKR
jgi:hypothetical protein